MDLFTRWAELDGPILLINICFARITKTNVTGERAFFCFFWKVTFALSAVTGDSSEPVGSPGDVTFCKGNAQIEEIITSALGCTRYCHSLCHYFGFRSKWYDGKVLVLVSGFGARAHASLL